MRYRMEDSQFAQSQDKMQGSTDVVLKNNVAVDMKPMVTEDVMHEYQQNYVLSSKISSQTRNYFASGPGDVLPLPSSLPKRNKKKKKKQVDGMDNPQDEEMLQQQMIMAQSMQNPSTAAGGMPSLPGMPQAYDPAMNPPEGSNLKSVLMTQEEHEMYKAMKQNGEL